MALALTIVIIRMYKYWYICQTQSGIEGLDEFYSRGKVSEVFISIHTLAKEYEPIKNVMTNLVAVVIWEAMHHGIRTSKNNYNGHMACLHQDGCRRSRGNHRHDPCCWSWPIALSAWSICPVPSGPGPRWVSVRRRPLRIRRRGPCGNDNGSSRPPLITPMIIYGLEIDRSQEGGQMRTMAAWREKADNSCIASPPTMLLRLASTAVSPFSRKAYICKYCEHSFYYGRFVP